MTIEQEPKPTKEGVPPAYWPASGDLRVEKLTARYSSVSTLSICLSSSLILSMLLAGWSRRPPRPLI